MRKYQRLCLLLAALALVVGLAYLPATGQEKGKEPEVIAALRGHSDLVYSVALNEDGKLLATGSFDNTIKLWDTAGGKEVRTFGGTAGHQKMVLTVAISPNGQLLASGSDDNTLKLWDIPTRTPLRTLAENDAVNALALSPDGKVLASACKDGTVKTWSTGDFKLLFTLNGHNGPVTGVAFSGNGQILASSGNDRTVRFWNVAKGQPIATVGAHTGPVNGVLIHPNNNTAFSIGDDGMLKFWQVPPGTINKPLPPHAGPIHALMLSGDGNQVLTGGEDKVVRLSALASGKETKTYAGAGAAVHSVAINSNATLVGAGTADGRLYLWNGANAKLLEQASAHAGTVTGLSFHPQNTQLLTGGGDGLLRLWALPPVPGRTLNHPDGVLAAAVTGDGKRLYTGSVDKVLRTWDLAKNTIERQFTGHAGPVTALAVSGNGQILASGSADASIRFWNLATGKETASLAGHAATVTSLALNPAGNQLLSSSADGTVKLWQLPVVPPRPFVHPDPVTSLAVSPDGNKLLTGCADKLARLWNLKTGNKERNFSGHTLALTSVAFNGNGQLIAAGSADKSVIIWNASDGKQLKKIQLPTVVHAVAFSPDGKKLAAGLADNSIRLLNIADGKELKNLAGHKEAVQALAYSPKGDTLISGSADKTVQLWSAAGEAKKQFEHDGPVTCLALSKDGKRLAAAAGKAIKAWDLNDGKEIASFAAPAEVRSLGISPDGQFLVAGGSDKLARVYDFAGGLRESFAHDGPVQGVAFAGPRSVITAAADKLARSWTSALIWQKDLKSPVRRALFSPKGDQVLAPAGKNVIGWNAANGKELKTIPAHEDTLVTLDQSADGSRLVTVGNDKTVKVWNLKDLKKPLAVIAVKAVPGAVSLSPNGQRLALAVEEQKSFPIRVFDASTGSELQIIPDHQGAIGSLAFLGDNRTLVSTSEDKTVRFSDVGVIRALEAHQGGVAGVQFHSNGTQALSAGADKTVKLWDLAKGTVLKTFGPVDDPIRAVTFSRDFTKAGAAAGKSVKVWYLADGKPLASLAHPAEVLSLSFSVDKTRLATGAADNLTRVWDLAGGKELQFFKGDGPVEAVVFDTKNTGIVSAGGKSLQLDTLIIARLVPASTGPLYALGITPNGTHVLTGGADKQVKLWNINNGVSERTFSGAEEAVKAVAVSKNIVLVAIGGADKTVRVHNFSDAKELGAVKTEGLVQALAFSPNNQALAAACADKNLLTWDSTMNPGQPPPPTFLKPIQPFGHQEAVTGVVFAPDNAVLYSSGQDKVVHAWKLASPAPIKNFPHPGAVDAVAFNPAGTILASGCHDGKLRFFDVVKGVPLKEVNAHPSKTNEGQIYTIAFSPDGSQIVTGSNDHSLKLWDVAKGALVREFKAYKIKEFERGHQDSVFAAAFSPDGKFLASGSAGLERVIKIWKVADASVVRDLANPQLKSANPREVHSHPAWIYKVRYTKDGKYLVSAGDAPMNKGYLAVWSADDGKLLYGEAMPLGTFFGLAVPPDHRFLAVGAGPRGRPTPEFNCAYLLKWPVQGKQ